MENVKVAYVSTANSNSANAPKKINAIAAKIYIFLFFIMIFSPNIILFCIKFSLHILSHLHPIIQAFMAKKEKIVLKTHSFLFYILFFKIKLHSFLQ